MINPVTVGSYRLSPEFFVRTRLVNRCLHECAAACCDDGSWLSLYEAHHIKQHAQEIQPYLEQPLDFDAWDLSRPAFLYTPVIEADTPQQRCWFFTRDRRCALHALALDKKIPLSSVKPFFCSLFPLTLVDIDINLTEIAIDAKAYDTCLTTQENESWLYEQFEPDLRRILGEGYSELQRQFPP
ncbi:MAG: hypothetical protein M1482_02945 [Chloroflexi bacterium]|nr:hypothetical protein [Chloroflexota bacterium]